MVDGGDLFGQAVIRGVNDPQHLDGDHRVFVNHLNQIFGRTVNVPGQLQNFLDAFGKGGHAVNRGGQFE